jgi:arginine decarboxylase
LGRYQGVFPVKVNQMREVVETLMDAGSQYKLGIEAGSKPELLLALSVHRNYDCLLICNGYKDAEFLRFALMGRKIGKKVVVVAEKLEEIRALIGGSAELGVRPMIGIRIKLAPGAPESGPPPPGTTPSSGSPPRTSWRPSPSWTLRE